MKVEELFSQVMLADGNISEEEYKTVFFLFKELDNMTSKEIESLEKEERETLLACLCLLAISDGHVDKSERIIIYKYSSKLHMSEKQTDMYIDATIKSYQNPDDVKSLRDLTKIINFVYKHPANITPETTKQKPTPTPKTKDEQAVKVISKYGFGAAAAMIAVPVPGADIAATCAVWAKMIIEIAAIYDHKVSFEDAKNLAADLFKPIVLTGAAWFGSAKLSSAIIASTGAGLPLAYLIDAVIASIGLPGITTQLGTAAAIYYKSDKKPSIDVLAASVKKAKTIDESIKVLAQASIYVI